MPTPELLDKYGSWALIAFALIGGAWLIKSVLYPLSQQWLADQRQRHDSLVGAFREENKAGRQLALDLVAQERDATKDALDRNNAVIERNTRAVESLETTVQTLMSQQHR
jgi:hypothetical protein